MLVVSLFLEGAWSNTFDVAIAGFSAVIPYVPLEVQAHMLLWVQVLSLCPIPSSLTLIHLIHKIGVMPSSGVYFWCHPGSRFIIHVHCRSDNRTMVSPVIQGCLFTVAYMMQLLYSLLLRESYLSGEFSGFVNCLVLASSF